MTETEWQKYCNYNPPIKAAQKLRQWVMDGQPDGFLEPLTWREMAHLTAEHYKDKFTLELKSTDFYSAMCGHPLPNLFAFLTRKQGKTA